MLPPLISILSVFNPGKGGKLESGPSPTLSPGAEVSCYGGDGVLLLPPSAFVGAMHQFSTEELVYI